MADPRTQAREARRLLQRFEAVARQYAQMRIVAAKYRLPLPEAPSARAAAYDSHRLDWWISESIAGRLKLERNGNDWRLLAPAGTTDDQVTAYQYPQLGVIPAIVWAVVVVVSLGVYCAKLLGDLHAANDTVDTLKAQGRAQLCADPSSPQCQEWLAVEKSASYRKDQSFIESLSTGIGDFFSGAKNLLIVAGVALIGYQLIKGWASSKRAE